jgi:hypothetical protein
MAQITEDFAARIKQFGEEKRHFPLTMHEQQQLAYAWQKWHQARPILRDMLEAWAYFSEYDVPIGMKEQIEKVLAP